MDEGSARREYESAFGDFDDLLRFHGCFVTLSLVWLRLFCLSVMGSAIECFST